MQFSKNLFDPIVPSELLCQHIHLFNRDGGNVLDLACGKGQNGLLLKQNNVPTLFADINKANLHALQSNYEVASTECWHADYESEDSKDAKVLSEMQLQGAIIFKYLHRPLFPQLFKSIKPGGIIIYETFTEANRQFGRPNRSAFLLKENELKMLFDKWEILFYFEGVKSHPDRAIAQIVARKPFTLAST